jgi:hypothetical protein
MAKLPERCSLDARRKAKVVDGRVLRQRTDLAAQPDRQQDKEEYG